jgi:hypothetical protein
MGRTADGALALLFLARAAAALLDALEETYADSVAPLAPLIFDALALLLVRHMRAIERVLFLCLELDKQRRALERKR